MRHIETDIEMAHERRRISKGDFQGCLIKNSAHHKHITWALAKAEIPFTRESFGAGIFKLMPKKEGK